MPCATTMPSIPGTCLPSTLSAASAHFTGGAVDNLASQVGGIYEHVRIVLHRVGHEAGMRHCHVRLGRAHAGHHGVMVAPHPARATRPALSAAISGPHLAHCLHTRPQRLSPRAEAVLLTAAFRDIVTAQGQRHSVCKWPWCGHMQEALVGCRAAPDVRMPWHMQQVALVVLPGARLVRHRIR